MEQVVKAFIGLFIIFVVAFTGVGVINVSVQGRNANAYLDTISTQWEASNFTLSEAQLASNLPADGDYTLTVHKSVAAGNRNVSYATATLKYKYRIPLLGIEKEREISKSIR